MTTHFTIDTERLHALAALAKSRLLKCRQYAIDYEIERKIAWSAEASKRNRFSRWLWNLPDKPWTPAEALRHAEAADGLQFITLRWSADEYVLRQLLEIPVEIETVSVSREDWIIVTDWTGISERELAKSVGTL